MRLSSAVVAFIVLIGPALAADDAKSPEAAPPATASTAAPAVPAAPAAQSPAASRLPKPVEQVGFVPSGEKRLISFQASINPDCTSLGGTAYRVLSKPEHGEVSFDDSTGFTYFPSGNREHCNAQKVPGLAVMYQSKPDYVGDDKFEVLFLLPPTAARIVDYVMIVR